MQVEYEDPRKTERRDLLRTGSILGVAMLLITVLNYGISILYYIVMQNVYGYSGQQAYELAMTNEFVNNGLNAILSFSAFVLPFLFCALILKINIKKCFFERIQTTPLVSLLCVLFGLGMAMVGNIVSGIVADFFKIFTHSQPVQPSSGDGVFSSGFEMIFALVCTALIPALFEEFAFRGVMLQALCKYGDGVAIAVSSLAFALMHGNFSQIPFALILAFALGTITVITGSVAPAVIVHLVNNCFAFCSAYMQAKTISNLALAMLALGFVAIWVLGKKGCFRTIKDVPSFYSRSTRSALVLVSPVMLLSILLFLWQAFSMMVQM